MAPKRVRCAGCGKFPKGPVFKILEGKIISAPADDEEFTQRRVWGYLDKGCFNRIVTPPDTVMRELRKQSRKETR